jgi:hypothetical protein
MYVGSFTRSDLLHPSTIGIARTKIERLRVCIATILMLYFLSRGGARSDCLAGDLVTTLQQGGNKINIYHRDIKRQLDNEHTHDMATTSNVGRHGQPQFRMDI